MHLKRSVGGDVRGTRQGLAWPLLLWLAYGCASGDGAEGSQNAGSGSTRALSQALGTVQGRANVHMNTKASESVISNMGPSFEVTGAFNGDDSTSFITFTNNSRQVRSGASLMAWTTMDASGNVLASGRLRPPTGFSALWSDPSIARNRADPNMMYLSQLAIPTEKFNMSPTPGQIVGPVTTNQAGLCGGFPAGACIARSTDSGRTFTLAAADCVKRTSSSCPAGHFYDGTDMDTSPEGRVYAAYFYMATSATGSFQRVTNSTVAATNHPRIKWGPSGLYLLVQDGPTRLSLSRYPAGSSRTGMWTAPVVVTNQFDERDVRFLDRTVRAAGGPSYALDIGKNEAGADEVRIVFKVFENNHHHLRVYQCRTGSPINCNRVVQWETVVFGAGNDQFMPAIAMGTRTFGGNVSVITYFDRAIAPDGVSVTLMRSVPGQSGFSFQFDRVTLEGSQVVCPDLRGYWGDYDNMAFGAFGFFMRPFTDSSHTSGSCTRNNFTAAPVFAALHMSAIQ